MNASSNIRVIGLLSLACICLGLLCAYMFIRSLPLEFQIASARGQVDFFEEMRVKAHQANTAEAAQLLAAVLHYYQSGSKQEKGSQLDHIVELSRQCAIRDIIAVLRVKSGQDLGDKPQAWIGKLSTR